jgi:hypothetical protein
MRSMSDGSKRASQRVFSCQGFSGLEVSHAVQKLGAELIVSGNPGAGKSVLAAAAVQELMAEAAMSRPPRPLVTFFFFEYNAGIECPARRDSAYRSIVAQVLHQLSEDPDVLQIFTFAWASRKHGQLTATTEELRDLVRTLAAHIPGWYLIIDAVDECTDSDDLLLGLSQELEDRSTKVMLFGRPNVGFLRRKLEPSQILNIGRDQNDNDLRLYFDAHLARIQDLGLFPAEIPRTQLLEHLLIGADGMFQWARLMINHLQSDGLLPAEKLNVIRKLQSPEKLDDMYIRILSHLTLKLTSEQSLARRLFIWLAFGKDSLSTHQMQDILTYDRELNARQAHLMDIPAEKFELADFEHNVVMVTGSLVERRHCPPSEPTYSFIHGSVVEFIRSRCHAAEAHNGAAGTIYYFFPPVCEVEAELGQSCLLYMLQKIPGKPLSGDMHQAASRESLSHIPFAGYATTCWPQHLMQTSIPLTSMRSSNVKAFASCMETLLATLSRFLLNRLMPMVWVELMYTFEKESRNHNRTHRLLLQWADWAQNLGLTGFSEDYAQTPRAIAEFTRDLIRLHELWGDTLLEGPHQIWNDITAFTTSPFFVQTSALTIKSLCAESRIRSVQSGSPLSKISQDDPSTDILAVLTIWPSR